MPRRMVNEVNKLIYNLLLDAHAVFLPDVGTLHIVRQKAQLDGRKVVSPRYNVEFSSHLKAVSIVDYIVKVVSCTRSQAEDIYRRWLTKVSSDKSINIEGVGSLCVKSFIADKALFDELNRLPKTLDITRKIGRRTVTWVVAALCVVAVGAAGWLYMDSDRVVEAVDEPEIALEDIAKVVEEEVSAPSESLYGTPVVEQQQCWYDSEDIRHWVVVGSYSIEDNAQRAVKAIEEDVTDVNCRVYTLGKMYAVVVFGSSEREVCEEFIRERRSSFKQAWIHTPKRFK